MADPITLQLPGQITVQRADGTSFPLSMIAAHRAVNKIADECHEQKLTNFEYAEKFAEWVLSATNDTVRLNPDEANFLFDWVQVEFARQKKATLDELRRNSPSSTEPTP